MILNIQTGPIDPGKSISKKKTVHYEAIGAFIQIMIKLVPGHG